MKKILLIVNGPAYGADETFNALRLAIALTGRADTAVTVFLMGDAVTCAIAGQKTPDGYYTLDRMLTTTATAATSPAAAPASTPADSPRNT